MPLTLTHKLTLDNLEKQMVPLDGGDFMMGSESEKIDESEEIDESEKPVHKIFLDPFEVCRYPVTQALGEAVMEKNPSRFQGAQKPVDQVDWYDAVEFCNKLSFKKGLEPYYHIDKKHQDLNNQREYDNKQWLVEIIPGSNGYRLPTEAEWEYAARGGQDFNFAGSPLLEEVGWYDKNSQNRSWPVGLKAPNAYGLYDLSGNLWEWCWDWYDGDYYKESTEKNPTGPKFGKRRVVRGGSWLNNLNGCRVSVRNVNGPGNDYSPQDFRLFRYSVR